MDISMVETNSLDSLLIREKHEHEKKRVEEW